MKREFLKAIEGLTDEAIDKIMAENGKDIEATKGKYADYDDIKAQLTDASKTIDGFKALDVDGIKKAATEWESKAKQAEIDAAAKIADMQFDSMLAGTVSAVKGKNTKAIRALLDVDTLKTSKNQEADIKAALEGLKADNAYLFDDGQQLPPLGAPGAGGTPINPNTKYTPEINSIRAAAGLKTE